MEVTLNLKICDAKLYRDTETIGQMDPYINMLVGDQKFKTKVLDNAGKYPKWDESFNIKTKLNTKVKFSVMDKNTTSDDIVGDGDFDLLKNYVLSKKSISAPIQHKGELAGIVRMEVQLTMNEKYHKQIRQELEDDLKEKRALVESLKKGEKIELPKQLIYQPPLAKKGGEALEEAEEKELKDELAALKKELEITQNKRQVNEKDSGDMTRRMLSGNLIKAQLKKHIDTVKSQSLDFRRKDIKGSVIVKVLRAKLNNGSSDPIVVATLGKKSKKTKIQDEDKKQPVWNETLILEKTENDESVLNLWVMDEGINSSVLGITSMSIYPALFSRLDEKYNLPLHLGNEIIGELIFHICFKRQ